MEELLGIIGILILVIEIYRILRRFWIRRMLAKRKTGKRTRKPQVMRPKSEKDCPFCVAEMGKKAEKKAGVPQAWSQRRRNGGRRKTQSTQGWFCPNEACEYYRIEEETIHALVRNGRHGKYEAIQDLKCQACGKKFTVRRNTVLYRLKTDSRVVEKILWLMALGVDSSALEEVFEVRESTIRSWLCRSGQQGRKLHERMMVELELIHVQLDELWADVKHSQQEMWLWVASDAQTKLIPVIQVGGRTQEMAYGVVHELKSRLKVGCIPVFSTDGLKNYYYGLTAHFGKWKWVGKKKPVWELISGFVYGQVVKHQRKRVTVEVERRMLAGEEKEYRERLKAAGLSGRINMAYVERLNLTIRQCVSKLTRRTWGPAQYTPELVEKLEYPCEALWWRSYYHFARYHESLEVRLEKPVKRKGKQQPRRIRRRTPATPALHRTQ